MIPCSLLTIVGGAMMDVRAVEDRHSSVLSLSQKGSYVAACPFRHIVWPGLSLSASSTLALDCTLECGFGQGLVTGDMTVSGKLASLRCCKERFLFAYIGGVAAWRSCLSCVPCRRCVEDPVVHVGVRWIALWKHEKTQHALKSGRRISLLIVAMTWKEKTEDVTVQPRPVFTMACCLLCWQTNGPRFGQSAWDHLFFSFKLQYKMYCAWWLLADRTLCFTTPRSFCNRGRMFFDSFQSRPANP